VIDLTGSCWGCGVVTDSGLILEGPPEYISAAITWLGQDEETAVEYVLAVAEQNFGCSHGCVPDATMRLMAHVCKECAEWAEMRTGLILPGADLPEYKHT
jgi:hypothetical protein